MSTSKNKVTITQAFKEFIWPRRKIVFIGLILIVISRLASLVLPGASKYLSIHDFADTTQRIKSGTFTRNTKPTIVNCFWDYKINTQLLN